MGNEQSENQNEENEIINPPDLNSSEPIFNFGIEEKEKKKKEQVQFSRRKEQRKTIGASSNSLHLQNIQNMMKGEEQKKTGKSLFSKKSKEKITFDPNIKENNKSANKENKENSHFQRRNNRSISLVQKRKLGSQVFKDELKIKVSINNLVNETQGLPTMKYKVTNKIGEGSYGAVYLAFNLYTKQKVAIKRIVKNEENKIDELELINEINILKKLSHPNILKIIEFYQSEHSYYIITDHCSNGELYDQIKDKYNENQLAVLFYQMLSGIAYLHAHNIVHRDLKLENILISEIEVDKRTNDRYFWIKIIDFGTAKFFDKNKKEKSVVGSSYYIAPEVLKKSYNEKCDTWSIGVILYMLIVGRAPFDGADDEEIISNIKKGKYNSNHKKLVESSNEVQDLVKKLLLVDSKKRLSAIDALKHPWFKKFNAKCIYSNISEKKIKNYLERLRKYQINSKFQQMVWLFIVHNVPDTSETKDILKMFRLFNENDDGKLSKEELYNALIKYFNKNDINKEIDDLLLLLDGSNKGYIEYEEFLGACMDKNKLLSEEHLTYAFNFFDKSSKGRITFDAIKGYFVNDKTDEVVFRNIFDEIDTNKDGEIDYSEFKAMMFGN
jgi:calcium-dependent protein kinase